MTQLPKVRPGALLVPTDFTDHSIEALAFALDLGARLGRDVVLLHVIHDPAESPGFYTQSKSGLRTMDDVAQEMMDDFLAKAHKAHPDINMAPLVRMTISGIPTQRILEVAKKIDAAQIVMGSHGRHGIRAFLIGSKALKVVQWSPIPVTIVKARAAVSALSQPPSA
jgi:nucleotide-binding universal stress UspA family protein